MPERQFIPVMAIAVFGNYICGFALWATFVRGFVRANSVLLTGDVF